MVKSVKESIVEQVQEQIQEQVQIRESVYSRDELLAAAPSFGVKPEVVAGALCLAGKDVMTRTEAKKAIKTFLERKVE